MAMSQRVEHSEIRGPLYQHQEIHIAGGTPLDHAVRRLAASVDARVLQETGQRSLWTSSPLVVRVRSTERPVQARESALLNLEGDSAGLAGIFRDLPHRQLAIIGEQGAGKTVQALLLTRELLPKPVQEADGPVPVFLSLASWHPDIPLMTWMAARIQQDHPDVGESRAQGRETALRLIRQRRIVPVLDGLDEVRAGSLGEVIEGIGAAFDDRAPFVVTCRREEYVAAVEASGAPLARAAVVEIDSVKVEDAIRYLSSAFTDDTRWRPLFQRLRDDPDGPVAHALSTPLMLFLARTAYKRPTTNPDELLAHSDVQSVEEHLLDAYIPATYARHLGLPYSEYQAKRWLGTLARSPREVHWWHFHSPIADFAAGLLFGLGTGWILHLMWNTAAAIGGTLFVLASVALTSRALREGKEIVITERETADPRSHLRRYRMLAVFVAAVAGIAGWVGLSAWIGGAAGADSVTTMTYALVYGSFAAAATLISTAWGRYMAARLWLAVRGLLPFHLLRFIEDAHSRGVLRKPGVFYEFRHVRLQERLRAGNSLLLQDHPYEVVKPETSRLQIAKAQLYVPVIRLVAHLAVIFITALVLGATFKGGPLEYETGKAPTRYDVHFQVGGGVDADFTPIPAWGWTMPPSSAVTSTFSVPPHRLGWPYRRLDGAIKVKNCEAASIIMSITANASRRPHTHVLNTGRGTSFSTLGWKLPNDLNRLTVTFRRIDHAPCTAHIEWLDPALYADQLFGIRSHFD
ncbi:hypothetical protein [Actinomadura latina]|uniref:NACHT domain-containing protein n=1 Tax=Actinomadura latina TaxID=163603 RepID=A0A846Z8F5_9ACTN|nr:hypothetical protein [Actinomadura latina]NKZ06683.1 hypothetical protein [Actinomadura latina]